MRAPGILAGLNDRSQSAYAAPAPNPVDRAIGHVRPAGSLFNARLHVESHGSLRTAEKNDRGDNASTEAHAAITEGQSIGNRREIEATHAFTSKSATEKIFSLYSAKDRAETYCNGHTATGQPRHQSA